MHKNFFRYVSALCMKIMPIFLTAVFFIVPFRAMADIAVIVNPANKAADLSREQVVDLFMGRSAAFPDGSFVLPFDLPVENKIRHQFYNALVGKTIPQINAYWARLIFSGRATPPRVVKNTDELLNAMQNNKNGIAYIDTDSLKNHDDDVKVLLTIKTETEDRFK
ncbi:MAG: hypothetical protein CSB28_00220 [Desulfobacterales bacterium]|nr:MAG: hypothetical protein CSB28_00220 [Desulfobacterales bacterium]